MNATEKMCQKIEQNRIEDASYAHALLHGLVGIYNHTPYPVRKSRLEPWRKQWPELVKKCLKTCSQTGAVQ